jgi:type II secretory pathway component PulJ
MHAGLARRVRSEAGYTILEVAVVMLVMAIITGVFLAVLVSVQGSIGRVTARSDSNDQARLAMEELDREIRSGNVLYDPNVCPPNPAGTPTCIPAESIEPGMYLLIYTQTNASTRSPGNQCVQWRIHDEQLQRRSWSAQDGQLVSGWRVVAERILNGSPASDPSKWVKAFVLDPAAVYGGRIVNITILANGSQRSGTTVRIKESITGRNTEYGYPSNICTEHGIPDY